MKTQYVTGYNYTRNGKTFPFFCGKILDKNLRVQFLHLNEGDAVKFDTKEEAKKYIKPMQKLHPERKYFVKVLGE